MTEDRSRYVHEHDGVEHAHGYGYLIHAHLEDAPCVWAECLGFKRHDFHSTTDRSPKDDG